MKKSDVAYIVSAVFVSLFSFLYCCTMWFHIKLPLYYPLEHTWKWVAEKGVPFQGWYGVQGFAFSAAGVVAMAVYLVAKFAISKEATLKPAVVKLLGMLSCLIILVCMVYILWREFSRWGIF